MSNTRLCKECRGACEAPARICAECQNERSTEKQETARRMERRKFAAMAVQGLLSACDNYVGKPKTVARFAVEQADALIAELDRTEKEV